MSRDPRECKESAWQAYEAENRPAPWRTDPIDRDLRMSIYESSNWRCCYCGVRLERYPRQKFGRDGKSRAKGRGSVILNRATIEHVVRQADGGWDAWDNLVAACEWCNLNRENRSAIEWYEEVLRMKIHGHHPNFLGRSD